MVGAAVEVPVGSVGAVVIAHRPDIVAGDQATLQEISLEVGILANRRDNHIARDDVFAAGDFLGTTPT